MYDIIGNVTDESNLPIPGVLIEDGYTGVSTDAQGYYALKTDKKIINFRGVGFEPYSFDLSKYKDGSSVNVDATLKRDLAATTYGGFTIVEKRNPPATPKNKHKALYITLGILALAGLGYLAYKKFKN
jgi:hypothetical protein